jgi:hypothetical protein
MKAVSKNSHHTMPSKPISANGLKERKGFRFYKKLLATRLSSIPGIDAAFVYTDDEGPVHVYSVVADFSVGIYKKLLSCERMIEKELPGVRLDFHVRAHQGRKPARAVPLGARPVFVR